MRVKIFIGDDRTTALPPGMGVYIYSLRTASTSAVVGGDLPTTGPSIITGSSSSYKGLDVL
jgi:hypothetical protein